MKSWGELICVFPGPRVQRASSHPTTSAGTVRGPASPRPLEVTDARVRPPDSGKAGRRSLAALLPRTASHGSGRRPPRSSNSRGGPLSVRRTRDAQDAAGETAGLELVWVLGRTRGRDVLGRGNAMASHFRGVWATAQRVCPSSGCAGVLAGLGVGQARARPPQQRRPAILDCKTWGAGSKPQAFRAAIGRRMRL